MAVATKSVFVLWHVHKIDDTDSEKLIGVYETEELAKEAIERLATKPGFLATPNGFLYEKCDLNRDHRTEGFVEA